MLDGDPGVAKSLLSLDIGARITTGRSMPDGSNGVSGGVVYLCGEDDPADTIRPRFDAAGGDPSRVVILKGLKNIDTNELRPPNVHDVAAIHEAIKSTQACLVVIDPIMAHLGGADSHVDADVRAALNGLVEMAQSEQVAVLLIRHLNKNSGGNPLYRGGGSIGIIAASRSGLLAALDPEDSEEQRRILTATKCNLCEMPKAIFYTVKTTSSGVAFIEWGDQTDHTAADLLQIPDSEDRSATEEAMSFLREILSSGGISQFEILKQARANGISDRTLRRAKKRLGVKSFKNGGPGVPWRWSLEMPLLKVMCSKKSKMAILPRLAAFEFRFRNEPSLGIEGDDR